MRGQILAVHFEKRTLKDTQHNSDNKTNKHKLLNKAQANIEAVEKGIFGVVHKKK